MMKTRLLLYVAGLYLLQVPAQAWSDTYITGTVACQGRGLAGVVVSDGNHCVQTDESGYYRLSRSCESRFVFVSTPSGYLPPVEEHTLPRFYQAITESKDSGYDFFLNRNPKNDDIHVCMVQADVQLIEKSNLDVYQTVINDMRRQSENEPDADIFGIDCGDIVGDTPSLYPSYKETVQALDMPLYRTIGNHDMDYNGRSFETSYRTFERFFGPTRYSFNRGKIHYMVINNNFYLGREFYYMGYVDDETFRWMEADLSYVSPDTPVVLILHIPTRLTKEQQPFAYDYGTLADQTVNAEALYGVFRKFGQVHIISGHMHYNLNICFNNRIMEHNTAAVCGTWWCADVCLDGTPRGYAVYKANGRDLSWRYKSVGHDPSYQARAYLPGASAEHPHDLIANVWNWDEQWQVEWMENGRVMGRMERFTGYDPLAEALCNDRTVMKYDWISPTRTEHLFKARPQNPSAHMEIRVTDRFGSVYTLPAEAFRLP